MARKLRYSPIGIAEHIIQRGNNQQNCFKCDQDKLAYLQWLKHYSEEFSVEIHAWVLMRNHVHLLCTPNQEMAISKMMQSLGRCYVSYFNRRYNRSGTLWEGRYKATLIDSENYLLQAYHYIELNPVRANIVKHPRDYKWSSYRTNALGKASTLITPHKEYLSLGISKQQRLHNYQKLKLGQGSESA